MTLVRHHMWAHHKGYLQPLPLCLSISSPGPGIRGPAYPPPRSRHHPLLSPARLPTPPFSLRLTCARGHNAPRLSQLSPGATFPLMVHPCVTIPPNQTMSSQPAGARLESTLTWLAAVPELSMEWKNGIAFSSLTSPISDYYQLHKTMKTVAEHHSCARPKLRNHLSGSWQLSGGEGHRVRERERLGFPRGGHRAEQREAQTVLLGS